LGTVLDAGTGSGKGAVALTSLGYNLTLCDLTRSGLVLDAQALPFFEAALWSDLRGKGHFYDWVYCCDVLEHLPSHMLSLTVHRLLQVARKGVFISVALIPDNMGAWVGRPLHLTVQSYDWWRDFLKLFGRMMDARDLLTNGVYLVEAT
jgi:2-polyprenyl-3-methyl-5-hydroxy-6-metoxy-1,4-benzoquinol methylase